MEWNDLANKLKSLGVTSGKDFIKNPKPSSRHRIDTIVEGDFVDTIFGPVFCTTHEFPLDYQHGIVKLFPESPLTSISRWAGVPDIAASSIPNIIFLDTETTGLSGGTGTLAFMVGVGKFIGDKFVVNQYFMQNPAEERALLSGLSNFLYPLEAVVTYNGKSFDVPLLRTRYTLNALGFPAENSSHYDLLHLARRLWRQRLPSCSLSIIENQILGVIRKEEEVPGYAIPELYTDYLRSGNARPMHGIFYHNLVDILSLAGLFTHTAAILAEPTQRNAVSPEDQAAVGRVFRSFGDTDTALSLYKETLQNESDDDNYWQTLQEAALIYKRQFNYPSAISLWEKAAYAEKIYACEELAKFYEHHAKDISRAIHWTKFGLEIIENNPTISKPDLLCSTFSHRLKRLLRKKAHHDSR